MKIFLDVGSNIGQTIESLFEQSHGFGGAFCKYEFDRIYSFEPVSELHQNLAAKFVDPRIVLLPMGLWKETCDKPLFSPGSEGGSIFADKRNVDSGFSAMCSFVRASDWFRDNLGDADEVYVKLNVEGSEVDIIEDLLASGEFRKIKSLGVTFDVRKIPSQSHREAEVRRRLADGGHQNVVELGSLGPGSFRQTIQRWLAAAGAETPSLLTRLGQLRYNTRVFLSRAFRYARRRLSTAVL